MAHNLARALAIFAILALVAACGDAAADQPDGERTGPHVGLQDDRMAVIDPARIDERVDLVSGLAPDIARIDLFWRDVAPTEPADPADHGDPAYDFSRYDRLIDGLGANGIEVMVAVYNAPTWATGGVSRPGINDVINSATPDAEAFGTFMGAVAERYSGDPENTHGRVDLYEIWNEANLPGFLSPQTVDGERVVLDNYAAMTRAAYDAIKHANPDATVIAGVTGPRGKSSDTATGVDDWIDGLAARAVPMDAYSQHVYPVAAPTVATEAFPAWGTLPRLESAVDRIARDLPIYITEAGYTTEPTPYRDAIAAATEQEQARYVGEIFSLPALRNDRYRAVVWFNLQDNPGWPAGLLREDGSRKPSYAAFMKLTR